MRLLKIAWRPIVASCLLLTACGSPPNADGPILDVCAASKERVGSRIRVRGEFYGTLNPSAATLALLSDDECGDTGVGMIWAAVYDRREMSKVYAAEPRRYRSRTRGDTVTVEGTIEKIEWDRFVYLNESVVTEVQKPLSRERPLKPDVGLGDR
jgi:hypothetical protein